MPNQNFKFSLRVRAAAIIILLEHGSRAFYDRFKILRVKVDLIDDAYARQDHGRTGPQVLNSKPSLFRFKSANPGHLRKRKLQLYPQIQYRNSRASFILFSKE